MAINTSTASGISQRTNVYAQREMLKWAGPVMVLDKFGKAVKIPKNKSVNVVFRRPVVFSPAATPLTEGVTPNSTAFSYQDVSVTLRQYGMVIVITDVIEDTHEDPVLNDIVVQAGENMGRTWEQLTYGVLRAGTNVFYTNGTARNQVNTVITLSKQRAVTRTLKNQKAMKITTILDGSPDYRTSPIEASFVAVAHTDLENDIRNLANFTPTSQYGARKVVLPEEIGAVEDVRYILSADLESFPDAGGAKGAMYSTTGVSADVYPIIYFGKEAYATVALKGAGAVEVSVIQAGLKTKDDPLGQRGYVGWKGWFAAVRLNELWMARMEAAVTAL